MSDAVPNPVVLHVHCFHALLFDCVIGDASSYVVVSDDDGRGMQVPHLSKGGSNGAGFFAVYVSSSDFCFCSRGDNDVNDLADDMDRSIWWW